MKDIAVAFAENDARVLCVAGCLAIMQHALLTESVSRQQRINQKGSTPEDEQAIADNTAMAIVISEIFDQIIVSIPDNVRDGVGLIAAAVVDDYKERKKKSKH